MIKHRIPLPPEAHELIDEFMPVSDASEFHQTLVRAPIQQVYDALHTTDLAGSPLVRLLLGLRGLTSNWGAGQNRPQLNLDAIMKGGFVLLGENAPNEIALGLAGRFWTLSGTRCKLTRVEFRDFDEPGYAKAVWNFSLVRESEEVTRLATETRILCLDADSRRRFRLYWSLIGPFSALIRREVLRAVRNNAEHA